MLALEIRTALRMNFEAKPVVKNGDHATLTERKANLRLETCGIIILRHYNGVN